MRSQDSGHRTSVDDGRPMCLSCSRHRHSDRRDLGIATYRTISTVLFDVGIATFRRGAIPIFWLFIRNRIMRRFLVKKTGDCGSPPTPKKPKADSELVAAREYEDRRRQGFKAAWHDEFAWLTYDVRAGTGRLRFQRRTGRRTGRYRFRVFRRYYY